MPASRAELFAFLTDLGIAVKTYDHPPIFTVEEGAPWKASWPGGHSKNLFLKDKKGDFYLISALAESEIRLNKLSKVIGSARLSFGRPEKMTEILGVTPGSVTGFALINTMAAFKAPESPPIRFILDKALMAESPIHFHPLKNDATTAIAPQDFMTFARACGHEPLLVDFTEVPE
ncbi:MAG: prolyl-tRNA synthetase associated domain-containing protein [Alphaproteobacteria bacterium]|nr:MAG: prolyl-tRNA synthetase associated domain-containing protein [Alphaproteobacteria bacterium]